MPIDFRVSGRIGRPVEEVFEAVADPARLSQYFTTGGAEGRLESGATLTWSFAEFPDSFLVEVIEVVPNGKIVFRWDAFECRSGEIGAAMAETDYRTTVTMEFHRLDGGRTLVEITEEGWRESPGALRGSYNNCEGWSHMICALKAWLEHGINLRQGMYE